MESQQMLEFLLKMEADRKAERKADKEEKKKEKDEMEAKRKEDKEEMMAKLDADRKTGHKELLAKMEAAQEKADADRAQMQEMMKTLRAYQVKTKTVSPAMREEMCTSHMEKVSAFKPEIEEETMACQEMEARLEGKGPTSVNRKPEAAQQEEVPLEDAEVMPVGEPKKKRRRDRKMASQHRRQKPKEFTPENCGPQKRMAVTSSGSSRRGNVTWHTKEVDQKIPRRATVARRRRDICRPNITRRVKVARQTKETGRKVPLSSKNYLAQEKRRQKKLHHGRD
jgi:hypothetical protein